MNIFHKFWLKLKFLNFLSGNAYNHLNLKYKLDKTNFVSPDAFIINTHLDPHVKVFSNVSLSECNIGRYSYIQYGSNLGRTDVGSFCSIAPYVFTGLGEHPVNYLSTHPLFHLKDSGWDSEISPETDYEAHKRTIIGSDVWIGAGVFIKDGIKIGHGAIIGAGSIVTKDVEPYAIVAGNPAKLIRKRFQEDTIRKLLLLSWWEWDEEKISRISKFFSTPLDENNLDNLF